VSLLELDGVCSGYGGSQVLHDVSIDVGGGEAVCLLGRNGVGKTTMTRTLMGFIRLRGGEIRFDGSVISGKPTHRIARAGVGYVPQGRDVFGRLTVEENLMIASRDLGHVPPHLYDFFPVLGRRRSQRAGTMSGGEQQQLAIARALATEPKLIVLDEPSEGVQLSIVTDIGRILKELRNELRLSILLIEQDLDFALDVADRGFVMEKGRIVATGQPEELRHSDAVETYLMI
jgi:branched-chain amino acid transport system ATP-binding protein